MHLCKVLNAYNKEIWLQRNVFHACNLDTQIRIKFLFQKSLRCKYSSYRNIYSLIINVTREEIKEK